MEEIKYRTCNLCEALCGLEITIKDDVLTSIRGDKQDVFSKGHICPKAVALKDIHEDPDRLKFPIQKVNGEWKRLSWDEAIQKAAEGIVGIQERYGNDAMGVYQGNPSVHNLGTTMFSPNFVRSLKTKNRFSATSVDQLGHHLAGEFMFGHGALIPVPDLDRTDFWLIMGGNPLVSNGSLMTAPNVAGKLKAIQQRGGKVVVIDPRRTETADKADQHIFIKPGTDIFLVLGWIRMLLSNNDVQLNHLDELIDRSQIEAVKIAVERFDLESVATVTGVDSDTIIELYQSYQQAERAVCYGRLGVSAAPHGGLTHWAINTLNILSGNFDRPGGSMLTEPVLDTSKVRSSVPKFNRWQSRVRGLPEYGGELPSAALAEEMLTPGEGQIKGMVTSCGNPVLSVPNGRRLDEAFEQLEFMVAVDIYINETTRHADIILPPATGLETPHLGIAFHNLAVRNTAKYSAPVLEKDKGTKYDWEIYSGLQRAIENLKGIEESPQVNLNQMLSMAFSMGGARVSFEELKQHAHGIDFGPLTSVIPDRLKSKDGHVNLFPAVYSEALAQLQIPEIKESSLSLIGRRHLRSNNSWLHNSYRMVKGRDRCTLLIHPEDALVRGIQNGDRVFVQSRTGKEEITAEVSDEVMQGVVSIPHGWGHTRESMQLSIASEHAGVSLNDLLDDEWVDKFSGVAVINGIPVDVFTKVEEGISI